MTGVCREELVEVVKKVASAHCGRAAEAGVATLQTHLLQLREAPTTEAFLDLPPTTWRQRLRGGWRLVLLLVASKTASNSPTFIPCTCIAIPDRF